VFFLCCKKPPKRGKLKPFSPPKRSKKPPKRSKWRYKSFNINAPTPSKKKKRTKKEHARESRSICLRQKGAPLTRRFIKPTPAFGGLVAYV
jgi:hypothetical protein